MNEFTDGLEDSHTHWQVNECVGFSWSFFTHKYLRTCLVLLLLLLFYFDPWRQAIILLRSSWPWSLEDLLAQPQSLQLVPAGTGKLLCAST